MNRLLSVLKGEGELTARRTDVGTLGSRQEVFFLRQMFVN